MKHSTRSKTTKKVSVVELPLTELKERLYRVYNDAEMVHTIISASFVGYDVNGLYIRYNQFNDTFTVKVSNPKYAAITRKYAYSKKAPKNNRMLNVIMVLSLIINTVFSILALCANLYTDYNMWFLLWAIAQINIIVFIFSTIKHTINSNRKRYK